MTTWQFVDSIASAPTVRLDLNTLTGGIIVTDQPEVSPPELKRVGVSSMMADGERVPAQAYANRTITLRLHVSGSTPDLMAAVLQNLSRELARLPGNVLRVTTATNPLFFKTFPAPDAVFALSLTNLRQSTVTINIPCEPFAYGLEEPVSAAVVSNNPANTGSNGMFFDITSPKGDVETPLNLIVPNTVLGANTLAGRRMSAFSVRRRGTVANVPFVLQAESMTGSAGVSLPGNDALMSGTGSNYARISYATIPGMFPRLSTGASGRFPATASLDARGTYRVYARHRQSVATDVIQMRLGWGGGVETRVLNDIVTVPSDTSLNAPTIKYVDVGLVQIPLGFDPVRRPDGVELATEGIYLELNTARLSGSGTSDVDCLLFVPADDRMAVVKWPNMGTNTDFLFLGGPRPAVYARNASGQMTSTEAVEIVGGGLSITPGRTNRVYFLRDVGTSTSTQSNGPGDAISATTSISGTYIPRYLFPFRPVGS